MSECSKDYLRFHTKFTIACISLDAYGDNGVNDNFSSDSMAINIFADEKQFIEITSVHSGD